jgi:predicted nuclease of predicted toxin-antitoxin system
VHWIVDAQLPPDLARWLEKRGHEAEHVEDVGLRNADDPVIWQRALQHNAVILTKDEDFVLLAATNPAAPVIVWLRLGNASTRALLAWLEPQLPAIESRLQQGEKLIEVR